MDRALYLREDVFSWAICKVGSPPPIDASPTIPKKGRVIAVSDPYKDDNEWWHGVLYRNRRYEVPCWCLTDLPPSDEPSTDTSGGKQLKQREATAQKGIY